MKSFIAMIATLITINAQAFVPSFSNSDFDATVTKANQVALRTAKSFASNRGEELVSFQNVNNAGALTAQYKAETNSGCEITVQVGLFFKSKITRQSNCK